MRGGVSLILALSTCLSFVAALPQPALVVRAPAAVDAHTKPKYSVVPLEPGEGQPGGGNGGGGGGSNEGGGGGGDGTVTVIETVTEISKASTVTRTVPTTVEIIDITADVTKTVLVTPTRHATTTTLSTMTTMTTTTTTTSPPPPPHNFDIIHHFQGDYHLKANYYHKCDELCDDGGHNHFTCTKHLKYNSISFDYDKQLSTHHLVDASNYRHAYVHVFVLVDHNVSADYCFHLVNHLLVFHEHL
ncbi:hypothetical protein TASIC1_0009038100 [Trichoderma asperellum]|uniref:Uncharacterized protein n=1 Tax=Trichoderma asperellum TaxID=101201 RepID=A0A6V8QZ49_TRIAP|nr:hypothetical protein TASIC1_0009038100 [Trichoderma asperellum]